MRLGRTIAATLTLGLAACGGGQPTEEPVPAETLLGYSLPALNPLTYSAADTARVDIELQPGMPLEQKMGQSSRVRLSFAPTMGTAGNLTVTAQFIEFGAFMESSMTGREDVGADAVQGEFTLSVTPEGVVEEVAGPDLPPEVQQMMMGQNMFADFFVRLPNRVVTPGETWTDTVSTTNDMDGATSTTTMITVSTLRGDTTVAGRRLWIIDRSRSSHALVEGNVQGMDMRNEMSGTVSETTLWDPARRLLVSSRGTGEMTGSVSMPAAGMNDMPLRVSNTRTIRLIEGDS